MSVMVNQIWKLPKILKTDLVRWTKSQLYHYNAYIDMFHMIRYNQMASGMQLNEWVCLNFLLNRWHFSFCLKHIQQLSLTDKWYSEQSKYDWTQKCILMFSDFCVITAVLFRLMSDLSFYLITQKQTFVWLNTVVLVNWPSSEICKFYIMLNTYTLVVKNVSPGRNGICNK